MLEDVPRGGRADDRSRRDRRFVFADDGAARIDDFGEERRAIETHDAWAICCPGIADDFRDITVAEAARGATGVIHREGKAESGLGMSLVRHGAKAL